MIAFLYAAVFFLSAFFPPLISRAGRSVLFGSMVQWLPGTIAISIALFLAAAVSDPRLSPRAAAAITIAFEVASSYGIAAAELLHPQSLDFLGNAPWIGLSWVGVWTLLFSIVVPSLPRRSLLAGLAASSSVPVMAAVSFAAYPPRVLPNGWQFFIVFCLSVPDGRRDGVRRRARALRARR